MLRLFGMSQPDPTKLDLNKFLDAYSTSLPIDKQIEDIQSSMITY